jgi:multiple sugar transport system permease protein
MVGQRGPADVARRTGVFLMLCFGAALFTIPFLWTVSTALKTNSQVFAVPPVWIPHPFDWSNFRRAWTELPFPTFVGNTLLLTVIGTFGQVLSASLVAYGFARFKWRGRNALFYLMLSTMMLPSQVTMIPLFLFWRQLHLIDTFAPLVVPAFFGGGAFNIFLLRQFFLTIPTDLEDAARMDGASHFAIYSRIILPLARPALATLVILTFLGSWNNFLWPLVVIDTPSLTTVPLSIVAFQGQFTTQWNLLMACATMALAPVLVVYLLAQRYFVEGIALTGQGGR